jgi:hypothetical protein
MKQQQANIIEAKAAIKRADESVMQGRSIVVFTVVTIFFVSWLPGRRTRSLIMTGDPPASTLLHNKYFRHERRRTERRRNITT